MVLCFLPSMVMDCLVTDVLVPEQLYSMLTWTVATLGQDKQAEPKLDMSEQITDGSTRQGVAAPSKGQQRYSQGREKS